MTQPKIGLALGSGAARGWAHIGVIEALAQEGIAPDIICGTSMGALIGAALVSGRLDRLRTWAETAGWRQIVPLIDFRLIGGGFIEGRQVIAFLRDLGITGRIEEFGGRFAAVATDLATGREIWLRTGPVLDAVRASIAVPGIISPARIDGRWLVDGGLCNPVPVTLCRALGAEVIIAVNLNGDLPQWHMPQERQAPQAEASLPLGFEALRGIFGDLPAALRSQAAMIAERLLPRGGASPGYFDVLANSIHIMQDQITRARLADDPPDVVLAPRLGAISLTDFNRAAEAIAEGRNSAQEAVPAILRRLGRG